MSQKKKKEAEVWLGYYPFCTGSRYSKLYRDTRQLGAARGAIIRSGRLAWPGVTRPRYGPVRARHSPARARLGFCLKIKFCIVSGEGCDTASPDATTRRPSARMCTATRQGGACDTARGATTRRPCAMTRPRHDQCTPATRPQYNRGGGRRYGPTRATTRRYAHGLGAACMQPRPWVCALCTQPSFDLVHCSESQFRNTVH